MLVAHVKSTGTLLASQSTGAVSLLAGGAGVGLAVWLLDLLARLPQLGVVSDENHGFWLPARPGVPAKPGGTEFVACQNPV